MNKKLKSVISLISVLLLSATVTIGCGKKTSETPETKKTPETTKTTENASTTDEKKEETVVPDLNGRKIKIVAWWDETPKEGSEIGDLSVKRRQDIEKKYNCEFEYLTMPADDIPVKYAAAAMAGNSIGDIIFMRSHWAFPSMVNQGFLYELDKSINFDQPQYNQDVRKSSTYDGHVYGLSTYNNGVSNALFFNKSIFEKAGVPDLYELVKNKQWTWDKFLEVAKMVTKDTNGDGQTDVWATGGFLPFTFIYSNNTGFTKVSDGKTVSALTDDNTIEALQYLNKLQMIDKVIETVPAGSPWDYSIKQFKQGNYAMVVTGMWAAQDFKNSMQDKFGLVPMPMGPKAANYTNPTDEISVRVIPAAVKDADVIAKVYDEYVQPLVSPEEEETAGRSSIEANLCDAESVEMAYLIMENQVYADYNAYPDYWSVVDTAVKQAINGEKSAKTAMEEINSVWQSKIDSVTGSK